MNGLTLLDLVRARCGAAANCGLRPELRRLIRPLSLTERSPARYREPSDWYRCPKSDISPLLMAQARRCYLSGYFPDSKPVAMRELEIIQLLFADEKNGNIASDLGISPHTGTPISAISDLP